MRPVHTAARSLVIVPIAALAAASQRLAPANPLPSVTGLKCVFTAAASAAPPDDVQPRSQPPLTVTITDIDLGDGTARVNAGDGSRAATAQITGSNLYVLEIGANAVTLTTVFSQESKDQRLKAVHTRTAPEVAHFAGDCEILKQR